MIQQNSPLPSPGAACALLALLLSSTALAAPPTGPRATSTPNALRSTPTSTNTSTSTPTPGAPLDELPVPGGCFRMGQDNGGELDERPAHEVCLSPYRLDRTEVTVAAYGACVAAGRCKRPRDLGPRFTRPQQAVVGVSHDDALAYCAWRGQRLPTEAEWEYAARGTEGRTYSWGNDLPTPERGAYGWQSNSPSDVGTHPAGAGPFGHQDLTGNVWEWLADVYDPSYYPRSVKQDPTGGTCAEALAFCKRLIAEGKHGYTGSNPIPTICEYNLRGGAWNYGAAGLRATNRVHHGPGFKIMVAGFRCGSGGAGGKR